jgi:hypothetical protein
VQRAVDETLTKCLRERVGSEPCGESLPILGVQRDDRRPRPNVRATSHKRHRRHARIHRHTHRPGPRVPSPRRFYWLHNGWVTVGGEKISKSLGNSVAADALLRNVRPIDLRYYLGSAHYRSSLELDVPAMSAAAAAMTRIEEFMARSASVRASGHFDKTALPVAFRNALDDDLNVPAALAVLHDEVHSGNLAISRRAEGALSDALRSVLAMTSVLGINTQESPWSGAEQYAQSSQHALDALVSHSLEQRARARAAGDFASEDAIRDTLLTAGVVVHDAGERTSWSLARRGGVHVGPLDALDRARSGPDPPIGA